ncbi:LysR family transcriptional regulator [Variovorax sp. 350MFTsu5.1]|uniref:LysR family transcriptional regulator n=1 Tax=Variovorax sp. 350MFTsu5.1 TaxID=3158365 RepID=UPI003AAE0CEE
MDSEALATFLTVHRQGGVSAAATALSRTQSAISRRLALLEEELDAPLFERVGRGLRLSQAGEALLPHAEKVAAALGDAMAAVQAAKSDAAGTVHIAAVGTLASSGLAAVLAKLRTSLPGLDIRLQTATSAEVSEKVRASDVAVGLRYYEDPSPDLLCKVIHDEQLVVACAPSHPLAGRRLKSLVRLSKERWLAFPQPPRRTEPHAEAIFSQFLVRGVERIDWSAVDSLTAQKRLVEAGFGLAFLQASGIAEEVARGSLALIRIDDLDVRVPVACVVRRSAFLSRATRTLLAELERAEL